MLLPLLAASFSTFASSWQVSYGNDEMRGTAQKFLQVTSENAVNFEFPYNGGSEMAILVRSKKVELKEGEKPEGLKPTEAMLMIEKGQFLCSSYNDCHISAKFDDGKIQTYPMVEAADASSDVIFFSSSSRFIKNLQSHKKVIIEAEFFQAGKKQFKFNIDGFPKQ